MYLLYYDAEMQLPSDFLLHDQYESYFAGKDPSCLRLLVFLDHIGQKWPYSTVLSRGEKTQCSYFFSV